MATETSKTTSPGNAPPTPQQIPLAQIRDLPGIVNIRTYTPKDLGGLVSSIQSVGVREPIIVRRSEDGTYQLLAGQRRRKASELAKKTTIPALVYEMTLEEARTYHKAQTLDPKTVMEQVGLSQRMNNFPAQLSGGEQQRVSIARALCKNPALLLCDEPTGALDSKTGVQVLSLLTDVCRTHNATVVIITHNAMIAPLGNRVIHVKNGGIESIETCEHPARVEDIAW